MEKVRKKTVDTMKYLDVHFYLQFCSFTLMIMGVIGSNVISAIRLVKSKDETREGRITELNKKATITVLILSVLFCSFNLAYVTFLAFYGYSIIFPYGRVTYSVIAIDMFYRFAVFIAIPLNSALNPITYDVSTFTYTKSSVKPLRTK